MFFSTDENFWGFCLLSRRQVLQVMTSLKISGEDSGDCEQRSVAVSGRREVVGGRVPDRATGEVDALASVLANNDVADKLVAC